MPHHRLSEVVRGPFTVERKRRAEAGIVGRLAAMAHEDGMRFVQWPQVTWTASKSVRGFWMIQATTETTARQETS